MELELTQKQFRRLLDMVYIGNWILNSTRGEDRFRDYDEVESLLFTAAVAVPVYFFNVKFGTNFMFLMWAEPGNPLLLFEDLLGHHLLGVPVLGIIFIGTMYLILHLCRKNTEGK